MVPAQFITVFLGSFVAGSFFNQAKELINNPTSIVSTLGTSAPLTAIFFLTFIELNVRDLVPLAQVSSGDPKYNNWLHYLSSSIDPAACLHACARAHRFSPANYI